MTVPDDYVAGLLGGLLMGVGCAGLLFFNGKILGVSGVLGGAFRADREAAWRWAFIGGMVLAGLVTLLVHPVAFTDPPVRSAGAALVGGLLVGAGTQLGSGCTSGHGICGMGRFSKRSLAATIVFMLGGAVSVFAIARLVGGRL